MEPMTPDEQRLLLGNLGIIWKAVRMFPGRAFRLVEADDLAHALIPEFVRLARAYDPTRASFSTWMIRRLYRRACSLLLLKAYVDGPLVGRARATRKRRPPEQSKLHRDRTDAGGSLEERFQEGVPYRARLGHTPPPPGPLVAALENAVRELAPLDRAVVECLFGVNGHARMTGAEIGRELGVSKQAVYNRLIRIRAQLRRCPGLNDLACYEGDVA